MNSDRRVAMVMAVLSSKWNHEVHLADLCAIAGLGVSRLEALFKSAAGVSIREFLHGLRLDKAAELIATTSERISQVVYSVGFRDVANFNHAFKKRFGIAPKEYRVRHQMLLDDKLDCDSYQGIGKSAN
jgi:AraC-like DNA-binding protein